MQVIANTLLAAYLSIFENRAFLKKYYLWIIIRKLDIDIDIQLFTIEGFWSTKIILIYLLSKCEKYMEQAFKLVSISRYFKVLCNVAISLGELLSQECIICVYIYGYSYSHEKFQNSRVLQKHLFWCRDKYMGTKIGAKQYCLLLRIS